MSDDVNYEWDEKKRISNLAKHGVDFADAAIFQWETARIGEDLRHDELRYTALEYLGDRLHTVGFTVREGCIRLNSFRKANERKVRSYRNVEASRGH